MKNLRKQAGIALIEAMVALLVFSLGMLAITKFNAYVVGTTGLTKARAEATHLAQGKIEELRNRATQQQLNALSNGSDTPQGISTNFNRSWTVSNPAVDPITIAVTVSWIGSDGRPESVALNSRYSWSNPTLSNLITNRDSSGASGLNVRKPGPTGDLRPATVADQQKFDEGTKNWVKDGKVAFVGNTGYVLDLEGKVRYVLDPDSNGNAQEFSWIQGRVYFCQTAAGCSKPINPDCTNVDLSSNGTCWLLNNTLKPSTGLPSSVTYDATNAKKFKYYAYECVMGGTWNGNVIVNTGTFYPTSCKGGDPSAAAASSVCIGDATVSSSSSSTSRHATNTNSGRRYAGFRTEGSGLTAAGVAAGRTYPFDGKPLPGTNPIAYPDTEHPSALDGGNHLHHHFAVNPNNNNPSEYCKTIMNTEPALFARNAGANVCIDPIAGTTRGSSATGECPTIWPTWASTP